MVESFPSLRNGEFHLGSSHCKNTSRLSNGKVYQQEPSPLAPNRQGIQITSATSATRSSPPLALLQAGLKSDTSREHRITTPRWEHQVLTDTNHLWLCVKTGYIWVYKISTMGDWWKFRANLLSDKPIVCMWHWCQTYPENASHHQGKKAKNQQFTGDPFQAVDAFDRHTGCEPIRTESILSAMKL